VEDGRWKTEDGTAKAETLKCGNAEMVKAERGVELLNR
jgi:hypothetical protein